MGTPQAAQAAINWATLIPVIIGGGIAVLGGVLAPIVSGWIGDKSQRRRTRAEKFEEMVNTIYDHHQWLDEQRLIQVFGNDIVDRPTPLPRAQTIAAINFPRFNDELSKLESAALGYIMWINEGAKRRLLQQTDVLNEGLTEAYLPYRTEFVALLDKLRKFAMQEFST